MYSEASLIEINYLSHFMFEHMLSSYLVVRNTPG